MPEDEANVYDDNLNADISQHNSMLAGLVHFGRIVAFVDGDPAMPEDIPRVLVQIGGSKKGTYTRNWIPWLTVRAGYDGEWWKPEEGELVAVIAPSGNLVQGIIIGSMYRGTLRFDKRGDAIENAQAIPELEEEHIHQRVYKDGTNIRYDRNEHKLAVALHENDKSEAQLTSSVEIKNGAGKACLTIGQDDAVQIIADAKSGKENITLKVGTTVVTIDKAGGVTISATGSEIHAEGKSIAISADDITVTGKVEIKGTLDVS